MKPDERDGVRDGAGMISRDPCTPGSSGGAGGVPGRLRSTAVERVYGAVDIGTAERLRPLVCVSSLASGGVSRVTADPVRLG